MSQFAVTGSNGRLATAMHPFLEENGDVWLRFSRSAGEGCLSYDDMDRLPVGSLDAIVHMAWSSVPSVAEKDPSLAWTSDFPLIQRLLDSRALKQGGQFVFFSSGGSVYGETTGRLVDEQTCLNPIGQYGAAKVYAEILVRQLCMKKGLLPVIVRLTNPYGIQSRSIVPQGIIGFAMEAAMSGRTLDVWGDGSITKDYIHVRDVSSALRAILARQLEGVFNLSSGTSTSLHEMLSCIEEVSGLSIHTKHCPASPWDVGTGTISNRLLQNASGWQPAISLMDGLQLEWDRMITTRLLLGHSNDRDPQA